MSNLSKIAVIGGGVIGRMAALELAKAGYRVTVITDKRPEETTSTVAGGLWKPAYAKPVEKLIPWANETYDWLKTIPQEPAVAGLQWVSAFLHYTEASNDRRWEDKLSDVREISTPTGLPLDIIATHYTEVLPIVDMSIFLPWLREEGRKAGVVEVFQNISSLEEAASLGELVVLATGLATSALIPDAGVYPIQGQIVRVANPGGLSYHQYNNSTETLYIIPNVNRVIIGGTHVEHSTDEVFDLALEKEMLERAYRFEPRLKEMPIVSRAIGFRPGRDETLVKLDTSAKLIHSYGHGGSGVTVSYGVAREILRLTKEFENTRE